MPPTSESRPGIASPAITWVVVIALMALPIVWLNVYLLSTHEDTAEYIIGRYSLLLGAAGAVALVVERIRRTSPLTAVVATVLAWLGVILGKVLGAGEGAYPWIIAAAAVLAALAAGMPGAYRKALTRTAVVLAVVTGIGLLGLA